MAKDIILFVCTGNIFRSLTAELALKKYLGTKSDFEIVSAGTKARPQLIKDYVLKALQNHELDASRHTPRKLTQEMLDQASIVIPMALSHVNFLNDNFQLHAPMFNKVCFDLDRSIPDIEDPPHPVKSEKEEIFHASLVIDYIVKSMPALAEQIQRSRRVSLELSDRSLVTELSPAKEIGIRC